MNAPTAISEIQSRIHVHVDDKEINVRGPYNWGFVRGAKKLAGKWQASQKSWTFDVRVEGLVRALCMRWYGSDGATIPDLVDVRLTYPDGRRALQSPVVVYGRIVASATGRDSGARLGEGVVLAQGGVTSSGSWANWQTYIKPETVLLMHDVPRGLVESEGAKDAIVEIIARNANVVSDHVALSAERSRLWARIVEIDAVLNAAAPGA